jgi:hypothetical protein
VAARGITTGIERLWLALGTAGLAACVLAGGVHGPIARLPISRAEALDVARRALAERGAVLGPAWRFLPMPDDGSGGPQEFVSETAGEARRRTLAGSFLGMPRWNVRVVTFEGDVAQRAEEWHVFVTADGQARQIVHELPEARPGAALDEASARRLAQQAIVDRLHLDAGRGDVKEISATPNKLQARTDWTFIFVDTTVSPLPQGEPRVRVVLAGDELTSVGRFIFVPEVWERDASSVDTRNLILQAAMSLVPSGAMMTLAVLAVVAWSRRRFAPRCFLIALAQFLLVSVATFVNRWPAMLASLSTSQPYVLQIGGLIGAGSVGLLLAAAVPSLVVGTLPLEIDQAGRVPDRVARRLGLAAGLIAAGVLVGAAWLRTPAWASAPDVAPLATTWPIVAVVLGPIATFLLRLALVTGVLAAMGRQTSGWTRRRPTGLIAIAAIAGAVVGAPMGSALGGWVAAVLITAAALALVGAWLLSLDLTMVPLTLGVVGASEALLTGSARVYPGAMLDGVIAAVVVLGVAWWWFRALRRWRDPSPGAAAIPAAA